MNTMKSKRTKWFVYLRELDLYCMYALQFYQYTIHTEFHKKYDACVIPRYYHSWI